MARHEPHDPEVTEEGEHPPMGERHGVWRPAIGGTTLAIIAMIVVAIVIGFFVI